jgi:hypothetical protein
MSKKLCYVSNWDGFALCGFYNETKILFTLALRFRQPSMMLKRIPVVLVAVIGVIVLGLYIFGGTSLLRTFTPDQAPVRVPAKPRGGVVLLSGITYDRISAFKGTDDFYARMWENRLGYTDAHGNRNG